ncbi:MAG: chalcone isomerase family protein [Pirellulaceae bacterium]|nr:chalcone isomerase family protein [Pirellulaceae bacterium]
MSRHLSISAILIALSCICIGNAVAEDGLPGQMKVGEHRLVLNGAGVRTKAFLELYSAGLYLTQPSNNSATILAAEEPMVLRIKITSSFVSQSSLVDSLEDGFKNTTGGNTREIRKEIDQFRELFKGNITKGDVFDIIYIPNRGVLVNKNGKYVGDVGAVGGTKFKQALFGIWLSDKPADTALKQALLTPQKIR